MNYPKERAPKIGVVSNSFKVFSEKGKQAAETQMREFFERMKREGRIAETSIFFPQRIFSSFEAESALDLFIREKIDGLIVLNSSFVNGNTFLTLATNPYLSRIPLLVTAPPEMELPEREWSTNAYCGLIMNNYVTRQIGRPMFTLAGWPNDVAWQDRFGQILSAMYAVKELRRDMLGLIGSPPSGFHSSSGNQLAYGNLFGTRVETIDLLAVVEAYRTGKAAGLKGEATFTDRDVEDTNQKMLSGRELLTDPEQVKKAARLFHAFKALIEANGLTSVAIRCWPEIMQSLHIAACFSIAWLLSERVVWSAACEGDWTTAVAQSIGTLLSGKPSACLDFVNHIGGKTVLQLGHCGVGIPGLMADAKIGQISSDRQAGHLIGPTCIGQFCYGPKTGICLIQDRNGKFKMLAFTGESRPDTAQHLLYAAGDIEIRNPQKLDALILKHGFPHHLAVVMDNITRELKKLCEFYDIEYVDPDE